MPNLAPDGSLYVAIAHARATDIYTLRAKPEVYEPRFTYHGFATWN